MRVWDRILRGDPGKASRFRDFEGRLPPPAAWLYLPLSLATALALKLFGWRPAIPWLGFRAIRRLRRIAVRGTGVLEFGAGMSTLWFARRGARVLSLEGNAEWVALVERRLRSAAGQQARVVLMPPPFADLAREIAGPIDFVLIDGDARDVATRLALAHVRPGGYVYLDNADVQDDAYREAVRILLQAGPAEWYTDFTPSHVFVSTGLLVGPIGATSSSVFRSPYSPTMSGASRQLLGVVAQVGDHVVPGAPLELGHAVES